MKILTLISLLIMGLASVQASTIRFTDLDSDELTRVLEGKSDQTVEFRRGDLIPLSLRVEGSLLSIAKKNTSVLKVEKDFFVKASGSSIKISFDGQDYVNFNEALTGSLTIGANGNSIPSMLNVLLHVEER